MKDRTWFWLLASPVIAMGLLYAGVLAAYLFTGTVPDWWCARPFGGVNGTVTQAQCESDPFGWW